MLGEHRGHQKKMDPFSRWKLYRVYSSTFCTASNGKEILIVTSWKRLNGEVKESWNELKWNERPSYSPCNATELAFQFSLILSILIVKFSITITSLRTDHQWRRHRRWVGCVHTPCQENTCTKNGKHTLWSIWFSRKLVKLVPPDVRF